MGRQRIVRISYPPGSTGKAQNHTSSGRGNNGPQSSRHRNNEGNNRNYNGDRGNLCHKTEGIDNKQLDSDAQMKQDACVIKLIDTQGNANFVRQHGMMSLAKHSRVMSALEKRALWYCRKGQEIVDKGEVLFNEAIGKTGTVSTEGLTESDDSPKGTQITIA